MCWSKEISMATFVLAIVGSIYLFKRNNPNDRWIALFAITVAMIQLAEFFMWSDQTCNNFNKYASMFALLILALEPLMGMLGGIYLSDTPNKNILRYMLFAYIIFIAYVYFSKVYGQNITWCGTSNCSPAAQTLQSIKSNNLVANGKACNLRWFFMDTMDTKTVIIWILFLMLPFLTMTPRYQGIIIVLFGLITFGMAHITNSNVVGSLWCWLAIGVIYLKILIG